MKTSVPGTLRGSWLGNDNINPSASQALGLVGLAIWGGVVVRIVIRDILKDRGTADRSNQPNRQRCQGRRHSTTGLRVAAEQRFVNRPAVALAAGGIENFDGGRIHG